MKSKMPTLILTIFALVSITAQAQKTSKDYQAEYDAQQAQRRAIEAAQKNKAPQEISPDMCVDGVCVEQDIGALETTLNWILPKGAAIPSAHRKAYEDGLRKGFETCEKANRAQWPNNGRKLCELLMQGNERSTAEVITFFKENKQPVCDPGRINFKMQMNTSLGKVRLEARFGNDGPKVELIVKEFDAMNKGDVQQLRTLIAKKHPYFDKNDRSRSATPWGGYVGYDDEMHNTAPRYELKGRSSIFAGREGPSEGVCETANKSISVQ
jgi:hypothetical protein